jgi:hypothetical protein
MTKRTTGLLWCTSLLGVLIASTVCQAATGKPSTATSRLLALASAQFPLTKAERALLVYADVALGIADSSPSVEQVQISPIHPMTPSTRPTGPMIGTFDLR